MGKVWSVGIFSEDEHYILGASPRHLIRKFYPRRPRLHKRHTHTCADPFLFVHQDELYLFAEIQNIDEPGHIQAWKTADLKRWNPIGEVLRQPFHCSYPFVFEDQGRVYMLPETGSNHELCLYEFRDFPTGLQKRSKLLSGRYADSNIVFRKGFYYLATTNLDTNTLELYISDRLGGFKPHPASPLTGDRQLFRNGGGFISHQGRLFRIAQDCSDHYGGGIVITEVARLSPQLYEEHVLTPDFHPAGKHKWYSDGRHHLSMAHFRGRQVLAMDGLQNDLTVNKALNVFFKFMPA
jgi:hypothetical protein